MFGILLSADHEHLMEHLVRREYMICSTENETKTQGNKFKG